MPKPPVRAPSVFDVARVAGVSHGTVSRVLNEQPNVRTATRRRVLAAIEELGYRPNRTAQALARGSERTLGVVVTRSTLFGPVSLLAAVEENAAAAGFTVRVGRVREIDPASVTAAIDGLLDQRVAGLVVIAPITSVADALADLPADLPLVTIDGDHPRGAVVTVDQAEGARLAVGHLLDAGHATVWHVAGPPEWFDAAGREAGWRAALTDAGIEAPPAVPGDWSPASGYRAGQLLGRMPEVTAVFAANDPMALGLLRALHELGCSVPGDVSVVGFDDLPESAFYIPPLTTVAQDFDDVGARCIRTLLDQLDGGPAPSRHVVSPRLVSRASVGPPRSRGQETTWTERP